MMPEQQNYKGKVFVGTVEDNVDPFGLERVRIRIPEIFNGIVTSDLPWAIPSRLDPMGRLRNVGVFGPPVIGSRLFVHFQHGDPHYPMYTGCVYDMTNKIDIAQVNYPNRHGWIDPQGNAFYVDMHTGEVDFLAHSGFHIHIDGSGNTTETIPGTRVVNCTGAYTINAPAGFNVNAPTDITGAMHIVGQTDITGTASVSDGLGVSNGLSVLSGEAHFNGDMVGEGTISLTGDIHSDSNITANGNIIADGEIHGSNLP